LSNDKVADNNEGVFHYCYIFIQIMVFKLSTRYSIEYQISIWTWNR